LKRLRTLVDNEHQCTERGRAIRLSGEFHLQLAQMAGNAPLAHFLESLVPLTSLAIAQFDLQQKEYCVEHMEILDALERGDAAKAQVALNRHLDYLEDLLLSPASVLGQNCAAG
jgi:DNA-binding GntR family transcriptional regulator